jgi:hypothetical protein
VSSSIKIKIFIFYFFFFFFLGPMEYLRGKRFWAFKKKDEQNTHHQTIPGAGASSSSLGQGIWRSGILGRRSR